MNVDELGSPPDCETAFQQTLARLGMCEKGLNWVGARTYREMMTAVMQSTHRDRADHLGVHRALEHPNGRRVPTAAVRWFLFRIRFCHSAKGTSFATLKATVQPRMPRTQAALDRLVEFLYDDHAGILQRLWGIGSVLDGSGTTVLDDYVPYQIRRTYQGQFTVALNGYVSALPSVRRRASELRLRLEDGRTVPFVFADFFGRVVLRQWPGEF